jgi:GntR family transcriptional repressor for pyruvate dehydrogenase complex
MPIKQIKHQKVSDMIFDQLKNMIINQEWAPGDKLPSENEIAQMMSVSRVSVRSALQRLASIGVIESRQGEGTFVCEYNSSRQLEHLTPLLMLTQYDYKSLAEYRIILECNNARLAAERCTQEILNELTANFSKYKKCTQEGKDNIEIDVAFHILIAKATQNPFITETFSILKDYLIMGIRKYQSVVGVESGIQYHETLIEAIRNRDGDKAYQIMESHLKETIAD